MSDKKTAARRIKAPNGTDDILPPEVAIWQHAEKCCREIFQVYNFQEIRTPIFEDLRLFQRAVGEQTDIVSKELFTMPGSAPREKDLTRIWKECYGHLYDRTEFEKSFGDSQIDVMAHKGDEVFLVEIKNRLNTAAVTQLRSQARALEPLFPGLVRIILAGPPEEVSKLKGLGIQDVLFQELPISQQEMEWLALRPENTAGVMRAYIEHSLGNTGKLQKFYYLGPQFRRERPQKGRRRQFYQVGAETLGPPSAGSESPARDAELITVLTHLLDELGIKERSLELNSIGCANDRALYEQALREALVSKKQMLCADCRRRADTNPLRVLDCKVPEDQAIIDSLPKISAYLDEPCRVHFDGVKRILARLGITFRVNERLVRGLDYYTRTTFEFIHRGLGAQSALVGGGRYDGLSEEIGGPKAPGVGFALGLDRLVMALQSEKISILQQNPSVYVAPEGKGMNVEAASIARDLRRKQISTELGDESFRLSRSLEVAEKIGAKHVLIVRPDAAASDQFLLKELVSGRQRTVSREQLRELVLWPS